MTTPKNRRENSPVSLLLLGSRTIGAAAFKSRCLEIMDEVERSGQEVVITKHRRAVARLLPAHSFRGSFCGALRGRVTGADEIVEPISTDWENDDTHFA